MVAQRAKNRCEYCLLQEADAELSFHVDHIISIKHGGSTEGDNLAYCCSKCNFHKGSDVATYVGNRLTPFFNPRTDLWSDHFEFCNGEVSGRTAVGEATARILLFNTPDRIRLRQVLASLGRYP